MSRVLHPVFVASSSGVTGTTVGHRAVQSQFFAQDDIRDHRRPTHVGDQLAHKLMQFGFVHDLSSSEHSLLWGCLCPSRNQASTPEEHLARLAHAPNIRPSLFPRQFSERKTGAHSRFFQIAAQENVRQRLFPAPLCASPTHLLHEAPRVERSQGDGVLLLEAEPDETFLAALVHGPLQSLHTFPTSAERVVVPTAGGEQDERVEHLVVEAGGVGERVVAALDRGGEARAQGRVLGDVARQVREPERDVARLVLRGEARDLAGAPGRARARAGTTAARGSCPRRAPTAGTTRSRSRARRPAS